MAIKAADIMTRSVVTAKPEDSVTQIAHLLCDFEISAVPVCDDKGGILGMISEGDLMRPFGKAKTLKRAWWLGVLAEGTELAPSFLEYIRQDNRRARDLMTSPVITATEETEISELADLMGRQRIKRLPITREGKLIGIVSRADIVHALAYRPQDIGQAA
ncbi:CBS domain-containing protein [Acidisoma sp. L85]|uniref:CBS domain-containing protein n=1 Tax=Acidisoma sp. L85 TaxID=1641850 RepID=UPI00131B1D71|nr:CBS domain-containing protein [Acidisoma sp. L85]